MTKLDHVVVNTLRNMDRAFQCFAALGFTLTPRGYHSLGSINHLMMTQGAYLELVGVPEQGLQRRDVLESPYGLNGLVLNSVDAVADFARLERAGLPAKPPDTFSRPVEINGEMLEARFRTVRFPPEVFPAGRLYLCEHLTPDLVWRPEWLSHPNGFQAIGGLVIESPTAAADAERCAAVCAAQAERDPRGWLVMLGDVSIRFVEGAVARFATVELVFDGLDEIGRRAASLDGAVWRWNDSSREASLTISDLGLTLTCRSN
ncbi:VOC family protein [Rhodopseudomonas sp. B29]|uniref:VOC family protein n=1 Tax=Rhodopseudomonas sp. B29 TaxID=95607 RepID=UPI0003495134|nr:VOC family protein [Rhodopseudomonas sp. B29]